MNYLNHHVTSSMSPFIATKYLPTWLILAIGGILALSATIVIIKKLKQPETKNKALIGPAVFAIMGLILIGVASFPLNTALHKGAHVKTAIAMSPYALQESNAKTISPSTNVPRDMNKLKGSIVIIYKYGCDKCENVHDSLQKAIDTAKAQKVPVYTVLVHTDIAQELIKEVSPTEAPIAVYVRNQPANLSGLKANYVPYVNINANGDMTFNQTGWESLLKRQQNQE